jgi:predicted signal transduction protein with EAL and GGDEF domain
MQLVLRKELRRRCIVAPVATEAMIVFPQLKNVITPQIVNEDALRGQRVAAGASAGVTILGANSEARRALEEADSAMYVRKAQRRHEATGE